MSTSIRNPSLPRAGAKLLNAVLAPVQELHHNSIESVGYLWRHYVWLLSVEEEREELLRRIKALEAENSEHIELKTENLRLRELLSFVESTGLAGVTATVVGHDPSNWIRTITIDKGRADGVRPGQPVIDGNAVVGQTTVVSAAKAKVLLLTDSRSAIDAIDQGSRTPGIVEGTSEDKLRLRYVLKEHSVKPGDRVIASGLDGVFPKGTLIGVVEKVEEESAGLFRKVELLPSVDFNRLENVLVITDSLSMKDASVQLSSAEEMKEDTSVDKEVKVE